MQLYTGGTGCGADDRKTKKEAAERRPFLFLLEICTHLDNNKTATT